MKLIRIHYMDASAVLKLVLSEPGSKELREYFENESCFTTTSLCFSEALGRLKQKHFYERTMGDEEYFACCDELLAYVAGDDLDIEDIEIKDRDVFRYVENLVRSYNNGKSNKKKIDLSDAFQIASVKRNYFSRFDKSDSKPILITGDKALADAARNEGLRVWYCIDETPP